MPRTLNLNSAFVRRLPTRNVLAPADIGQAAAVGTLDAVVGGVAVDPFLRSTFKAMMALPQVTQEQLDGGDEGERRCPLCGIELKKSKGTFSPECDMRCLVANRGCLRCGSDSHKVGESRDAVAQWSSKRASPEEMEARLLSCCAVVVEGLHIGGAERATGVCGKCLVPHDLFNQSPNPVEHPVVVGSVSQVLHLVYSTEALRARLAQDFAGALLVGSTRRRGGHLDSYSAFFRWAMHGARHTLPFAVYVVVWWLVVDGRVSSGGV
jgi:hypothetical protein